ncbi:hypothetical protein GUJ93_ZPchr0010g7574 [Zizania palustris]|uniref:Uncharacterized protein n=1 Tax=Zizania palustris TaxID=103762 RepID=A0A8J6BMT7_ZIZPA|nr:hypothetical protein GUJ93_ZPchr0010g7574 [Zizania palustris]
MNSYSLGAPSRFVAAAEGPKEGGWPWGGAREEQKGTVASGGGPCGSGGGDGARHREGRRRKMNSVRAIWALAKKASVWVGPNGISE